MINTLYMIAAAAIIGFSGGYYTKYKFDQADIVDEVVLARKTDAKSVAGAQKTDAKIASKTAQNDATNGALANETPRYLRPASERKQACPSPDQPGATPLQRSGPQVVASDDVLPLGTVRLLDAARRGTVDRATLPSDEDGRAASDVSFGEFEKGDREVVHSYNQLALEHNELVAYVLKLMKDQRKRMGISE
jgi:hypothetical protein